MCFFGSLNSKLGSITYVVVTITDTGSTAPQRLINKWSNFIQTVLTASGQSIGFVEINGVINFPANGTAAEMGTYWVNGIVDVGNTRASLVLSQYHTGDFYTIKNHGNGTYEIDSLCLTSRLQNLAVFEGSIPANTSTLAKVDDYVTLPAGSARYMVFIYYAGYSWANSVSVYFAKRGANKGDWYGVQQISKGSESRSVAMATDGALSRGSGGDAYMTRITAIRVSI